MALLSILEITERLQKIKEWSLAGNAITKIFEFSDFKETMEFLNKVADIAEEAKHYPEILINHNRVVLTLSTRSEQGLTEKDFNLAEKINKI